MDLLKGKLSSSFSDFEELDLFKQKIFMLDHVVKDMGQGDLWLGHASIFQYLNILVKMCIRMTSMWKESTSEETVGTMNSLYRKAKPALVFVGI